MAGVIKGIEGVVLQGIRQLEQGCHGLPADKFI